MKKREPFKTAVDKAIDAARWSPCAKSKRGAALTAFEPRRGRLVYGTGWNHPVGRTCSSDEACKAVCRQICVHAEIHAVLRNRELTALTLARDLEVLHVKVAGPNLDLVPSGGPSCLECSKTMVAAGVIAVWLYHEDGWYCYPMDEFHQLTMEAVLK